MPRSRACLSCGEPGIAGLCAACDLQLALDRLAEEVLEHAEALAEEVEQSALRSLVREHLRQKPRICSSRRELQVAIECECQPTRGSDGWRWHPTSTVPAPIAELYSVEGQA